MPNRTNLIIKILYIYFVRYSEVVEFIELSNKRFDILLQDYAIIMGHIPSADEIKQRYCVDEVRLETNNSLDT